MKILVVGAGFSGSVFARELARSGRCRVTIIDRREHIAGNAYDPIHWATGARYHKYGPHIFHTSSSDIVDYLSKFTDWVPYRHKVRAILPSGLAAPMPINRTTLNSHFGIKLVDEEQMRAFLKTVREPIESPANAQEHLYSIYGRDLTGLFFGRYTKKMWNLELPDMPISVVARLPVRYSDDPHYFNDKYQMMPANGYLALFEKMLDHENIEVQLNTPFDKGMEADYSHVFNSMPIDEYFDNEFGPLPYRSIKFEHRFDEPFDYDVPTVNFTDTGKYTRKTTWALYPGCGGEVGKHVTYEEPCSYEDNNFERYYPIKTIDGWPQRRYKQYEALAKKKENMTFIGRCGQYVYYDMHQVVASSLTIAKRFIESST
ncbi:MAG: UDP-galactopyranose mutase [Gammaproteobacteria bacterium]|nr:MAG: UDP-galactopyranose mutase [Gammaproteobacteria bacterium]